MQSLPANHCRQMGAGRLKMLINSCSCLRTMECLDVTAPFEVLSSNLLVYEAKNRMDGLHKLRSCSYRNQVLMTTSSGFSDPDTIPSSFLLALADISLF